MIKVCKPLTFQEREMIEKYLKENKACNEIARILNRSGNCISTETRICGRSNYNAVEAQKRRDDIVKKRAHDLSIRNSGKKNYMNIKQRIDNLEMQIEILFETIKQLRIK